jgi:hypothetical protein
LAFAFAGDARFFAAFFPALLRLRAAVFLLAARRFGALRLAAALRFFVPLAFFAFFLALAISSPPVVCSSTEDLGAGAVYR